MGARIGGPLGPNPSSQIDTPPVNITPAPVEKKEIRQEPETKSISAQQKNSQLAEHSIAGQMMSVQLQFKAKTSPDPEPQSISEIINKAMIEATTDIMRKDVTRAVIDAKPLANGDKGLPVEETQKEINKWRSDNGKFPIAVDGDYDAKTAEAVRDFQRANGLDKDSLFGPITRDRLALENDSNFKALSEETKKQVRDQMKGYDKDPAARGNLHNLATSPDFGKLSRAGQDNALQGLAVNPSARGNLRNVEKEIKDRAGLEANPDFKKLPDSTQKQILERMQRYALEPAHREQLMKIATEPGLTKLSPAYQEQALRTLDKAPADVDYVANLKKMVGSESFQKMDDSIKTRTLGIFEKNHTRINGHLTNLISDKNFGAMSAQQQAKTLNLFETTTMDGKAALVDLQKKTIKGTPALLTTTMDGKSTLVDQLDRLRTTNLDAKVVDPRGKPLDKARVMQDMLQELAHPARNINQGNRTTCTCTSMSFNLALSNPAEYARLTTDLATKGQATLANGDPIDPPSDAWVQDNSGRSVGERLFQSSLMRYARNGDYQNNAPKGLHTNQEIKVLSGLYGKPFKSIQNVPKPAPGSIGPYFTMVQSGIEDTRKQLEAGKVPVYAALRWSRGWGHAVEVLKIENGRVYFRNPWGGNVPGVTNGVGIDFQRHKVPPRRVEDSSNGIESMTLQDYGAYLKDIIVEK